MSLRAFPDREGLERHEIPFGWHLDDDARANTECRCGDALSDHGEQCPCCDAASCVECGCDLMQRSYQYDALSDERGSVMMEDGGLYCEVCARWCDV